MVSVARIERYDFGVMVVDGVTYRRDLIVGDKVLKKEWWRREGHKLYLEDIKEYLDEYEPEVLVVGTGYYGYMEVQRDLLNYAEKKGIKVIAKPTSEAVEVFNELAGKGVRVIGAFHLTC